MKKTSKSIKIKMVSFSGADFNFDPCMCHSFTLSRRFHSGLVRTVLSAAVSLNTASKGYGCLIERSLKDLSPCLTSSLLAFV